MMVEIPLDEIIRAAIVWVLFVLALRIGTLGGKIHMWKFIAKLYLSYAMFMRDHSDNLSAEDQAAIAGYAKALDFSLDMMEKQMRRDHNILSRIAMRSHGPPDPDE